MKACSGNHDVVYVGEQDVRINIDIGAIEAEVEAALFRAFCLDLCSKLL